ncbi:MAG: SMP-30/gluconolactonase/LRE family protein [candidate division KSB1 bacterium]|nr:SMP-30/gluconolactonase/LRE family protein [candidate division KSB1 bacterium]
MKKLIWTGLALAVIGSGCSGSQAPESIGSIHRDDARINTLIPQDAVIEALAEGFEWSEGPVWSNKYESVLFNDIPENTTYQWNDTDGLSIFLRPAGYAVGDNPPGNELGSNGLYVHPQTGDLLFCDHGNRCIAVLNQNNWTKSILADRYEGKKLNSPNDLVISSTGHIYFTDPPYGLKRPDFPNQELDFSGIFHLTPDDELILVSDELDRPNGIGLSPDGKTLYVANSGKRKLWLAFDVATDGSPGKSRVFFDATGFDKYGRGGGCDGLAVDEQGNIWATGPGGVMVFTPEGEHLGSIETGTAISNCCFGGKHGNELYMTADMYLCRVKVNVKGLGF